MNKFQMEINVLRVRKGIAMVGMAKSMGCNRKTLYTAFNSPDISESTAKSMCEAVGATMDEVNELVKQHDDGLAHNIETGNQADELAIN